jgi:hypothetical protein
MEVSMYRFQYAALVLTVALCASVAARANVYDFTTLSAGTAVTSEPGVTFDLQGGPDSSGPPTIGGFGCPTCGLTNSTNGVAGGSSYPTATILDMEFTKPVNDVSFTFANWGSGNGSFYTAWDGATEVSSGDIDSLANFSLVTVGGSDITDLQLNNNTGGGGNWVLAVGELSFTPTPEPGSLLLLGSGILGMAGVLRRKFMAR